MGLLRRRIRKKKQLPRGRFKRTSYINTKFGTKQSRSKFRSGKISATWGKRRKGL